MEIAMLLVADDIGIVACEVTAVPGCEVVFRVDAINIGRLVEMLIGAETVVNVDRFTEFVVGYAVDSISARFIF